jgi:hypothetical protein
MDSEGFGFQAGEWGGMSMSYDPFNEGVPNMSHIPEVIDTTTAYNPQKEYNYSGSPVVNFGNNYITR